MKTLFYYTFCATRSHSFYRLSRYIPRMVRANDIMEIIIKITAQTDEGQNYIIRTASCTRI